MAGRLRDSRATRACVVSRGLDPSVYDGAHKLDLGACSLLLNRAKCTASEWHAVKGWANLDDNLRPKTRKGNRECDAFAERDFRAYFVSGKAFKWVRLHDRKLQQYFNAAWHMRKSDLPFVACTFVTALEQWMLKLCTLKAMHDAR